MQLDERKRRILNAIIDDYIGTAEPIGSRYIAKKHEIGLSSATIRNEMADLEDMGYLDKPHTSAGRVPSDLGYRLYVNELMQKYNFDETELASLIMMMDTKVHELDKLLKIASDAISKITKYTTVVTSPNLSSSTLKSIQLVPVDSHNCLAVLITSAGLVKNRVIRLEETAEPEFIFRLSAFLSEKLAGLSLEDINLSLIDEIKSTMPSNKDSLNRVLDFIADTINEGSETREMYLGGASNIFNYPEYNDIDKAKEFLNFISDKQNIMKIGNSKEASDQIQVFIGEENALLPLKDCSVVTASYTIGGKPAGTISVIGPRRMNYGKVTTVLEKLSENITKNIEEMLNNG